MWIFENASHDQPDIYISSNDTEKAEPSPHRMTFIELGDELPTFISLNPTTYFRVAVDTPPDKMSHRVASKGICREEYAVDDHNYSA